MFNLSRYVTLGSVVRNFGLTKKLFASTSVLAEKQDPTDPQKPQEILKSSKNPTVAAVFASLNDLDELPLTTGTKTGLDEVINNAKTVNGLLTIAETQTEISRKHALKIVSILAEWSSINRVKLSDFETDQRFTKLCRVLGRAVNLKNANSNNSSGFNSKTHKKIAGFRTDDLNVVLGVTGDDEAAKLVASIELPQMVKVMKNLAMKKRRSTPLLRSLAFNMSSKEEQLDIKQAADVLYSMASLNFPDPVLISKLCDDILESMKEPIEKSSVMGSIISSLAFLRYREPILLDALCEWAVKHQDRCRTQDTNSVFMSLAILNYMPAEQEQYLRTKLSTTLTPLDFKTSQDYLGYVWSLMVLNMPLDSFFDSVLQQEFIEKLTAEGFDKELSATAKMKLLNINSGVQLFLPTYKGAMLSREKHKNVFDVPLIHSKDKQLLINAMLDAIKSLVPENCLKLHHDTSMGFVVDAEFFIDENGNPVADEAKNGKRVALMVHDFRDMCQGSHHSLNGIAALNLRLLSKAGYHVISVPYNEFNVSDKLLKRTQYLERCIKELNRK